MSQRSLLLIGLMSLTLMACGEGNSPPASPSQIPTAAGAPTLEAPAADQQLSTLRPTLSVRNGASAQAGARTYEFQVSDRSDFASGSAGPYHAVAFTRSGVAEGNSITSIQVDQDLQPATRFYWRARWVQAGATGDWSQTYTFRTQITGYNNPGELYDPLVNGATVADARVNGTTFVDGKGLRLQDTNAYVRYRLAQPIGSGEFSVDVEGLSSSPASSNGDTQKLKIVSMDDAPGNHYASNYLMNLQYRGFNGNPDHAISFKILLGDDDDGRKLEPDLARRHASVQHLNASHTYHWKATWGNFIQVLVQDGGVGGVNGSGSGLGGSTIYNYGQTGTASYQATPHFAYLGVNTRGEETGSWPATYRHVWIANRARPTSLGSAMVPLR